jgi:hypothetical protein
MIRRAKFYATDRVGFYETLQRDIDKLVVKATKIGAKPLVRLNVASDIDHGRFIADNPQVRFYDYTKVVGRIRANRLANYSLTYSFNERTKPETVESLIGGGHNVAVVFDTEYCPAHNRIGPIPAKWRGYPVIDGDVTDIRLPELDGRGVVVALRLKGTNASKQSARESGFAQPV